jgi:hypothetical protein
MGIKREKQLKLLWAINFSLELIFGQTNSHCKVLRRRRHIYTLNFELGVKSFPKSNKVIM